MAVGKLSAFASLINRVVEYVLLVIMGALVCLVVAQVCFRYILQHSLSWSEEAARFLLVWSCYLGATVATLNGSHIAVDVITANVRSRLVKRILNLAVHVGIICFAVNMMVSGWQLSRLITDQFSPVLNLPMSTVYLILPVAGGLITFYELARILESVVQREGME